MRGTWRPGPAAGGQLWPWLLLALAGIGCLVLLPRGAGPPTALDWALLLGGIGVVACCRPWPLAATLVMAADVVLALRLGTASGVPVKVAAAVCLVELARQRWGWPAAVGALGLAAAYTVVKWQLPVSSLLYEIAVVVGGPLLAGAYLRSVRQVAEQAQRRAEEAERRHELGVRAARMTERTALAREVHDLVAHHVASMVLRVGVVRHVVKDIDPRVVEVLDDVHASAGTALSDLRRLVSALRDPAGATDALGAVLVTPAELPAALGRVVARARQAGLLVDAAIDPAVAELDAVRGLAVLRLVQEGMTNVTKHAGPAARARLEVRVLADRAVRVRIEDDGGQPPAAPRAPSDRSESGHGLTGMRERVELIQGRLRVGPAGDGWRLTADLPPMAASLETSS
jgi:signal transduction histidine kinase